MQAHLKIIVQPTANSRELLRYINKNIRDINAVGAVVHIEKVEVSDPHDALLALLKRKGINRLPAMIDQAGKIYLGTASIIGVFDRNLASKRDNERLGPHRDVMGTNADLSDYYQNELYARDGDKLIPREDNDKGDDDEEDLSQRMRQYERNKPRRHRDDPEDERNAPARRRTARYDEDEEEDEPRRRPADIEENIDRRGGGRRGAPIRGGDDEMDRQMMDAMLDNLGV